MKRRFLTFFLFNIIFFLSILTSSYIYAGIREGQNLFAPVLDQYNMTGDPDCPDPNKETGVSYFCGFVKTNRVEFQDPGDEESPRVTNKPIKGAVVAVCPAVYTSVGKAVDPNNAGSLDCTNATTGVTDETGYFVVPMSMVGAAANSVYASVFCNGTRVDTQKVTSVYSHSVIFKVGCPSDLTPVAPPNYVPLANQANGSILTCNTEQLSSSLEESVSPKQSQPIGYSKIFEDRVDTVHYEKQFDLRYTCLSSNYCTFPGRQGQSFILDNHDGAWWSFDCVLRNTDTSSDRKLECYTDRPTTDYTSAGYGRIHTNPVLVDDLDNPPTGYLISNTLDTLPLHPTLPLYRRYEHRYGLTNFQQFSAAPASFIQNMFGNPVGSVFLPNNGQSVGIDSMANCEVYKLSSAIISLDKTQPFNSYLNGGPAVGMNDPVVFERLYNDLVAQDAARSAAGRGIYNVLTTPICKITGDPNPVSIIDIEPPATWLSVQRRDHYRLSSEYFNSYVLLNKYAGAMNKTADSNHDSPQGGYSLPREVDFRLTQTEAQLQDGSTHMIVVPEDASHANAIGTAYSITKDSEYIQGGSLTDRLNEPFPDPNEIKPDDNREWDIGPRQANLCSKPQYANDLSVTRFIDNNYQPPDSSIPAGSFSVSRPQSGNETLSTQIYYTEFARKRDIALEGKMQDWRDSFLSVFEADEDKIAVSLQMGANLASQAYYWLTHLSYTSIHGAGPTKSFYERTGNMGDLKILGLTMDYDLNEDNFGEIFPSGSFQANPAGTGGSGQYVTYPWHHAVDDCNAWGNQYYGLPNAMALCNADPNCLRTCKLHEDAPTTHNGQTFSGCLKVSKVVTYEYRVTGDPISGDYTAQCTVDDGPKYESCSEAEKFDCVLKGKTEFPDPPDPDLPTTITPPPTWVCCDSLTPWNCAINRPDPKEYEGDSVLWCVVDHAGPFEGTFDLDNREGHFRDNQVNVLPKPQKDLDSVIETANYWIDAMKTPYTAKKVSMGGALSTYEDNKRKPLAMVGKDTVRAGDAGTSAAFTAIGADPTFVDSAISSVPNSWLQTSVETVASRSHSVRDVTADDIDNAISTDPSCSISSCNLPIKDGDTTKATWMGGNEYQGLMDILNAAGGQWHVPAKLILSFIYAEDSLSNYEWNDLNAYRWSLPVGGTVIKRNALSYCDDLTWADIGVVPTYLTQWNGYTGNPNAQCGGDPQAKPQKCGVEKIAPGRGDYARRCNLLDAVYGLAKEAARIGGYPSSCSQWNNAMYTQVLNVFGAVGVPGGTQAGDAYNSKMWAPINSCN